MESRTKIRKNRFWRFQAALAVTCAATLAKGDPAVAQRALGLDVSAWQGSLSNSNWNTLHNTNDRDFVFIRSSRGGTTGYYNQSDPNNNNGLNTLSQRYDDPYFVQNITRATNAGLFAGPYHFSRPDVVASTLNSGGIPNNGADEADHFIQMAGAWMRPGYLLPVHDFEAGDGIRTDNEMAQFCIDFSNRIYEVMGIRPVVYINGNYANYVIGGASPSLRTQVVDAYPTLWIARWPNQSDPDSIPVQTANPNDSLSWLYGPWDDPPNPAQPWSFWQYASTAKLSGYKNGTTSIDVDVAHGGVEFIKDNLVPALWMNDTSGDWSTLANWNSGQTPVAPVQGPGQVARVGPLTLPATRLPGVNDTVILDRPGASIDVTLSSGTYNIRKLDVRETLNIVGGSLTINYVPSADSTPIAAQFSAPVTLSGAASLSVHTLQIDYGQSLHLDGGLLTFDTIQLMPDRTNPGKIVIDSDTSISPLANATAKIVPGAGESNFAFVSLGGAERVIHVANGVAEVDLSIQVPVLSGGLTKAGPGTLALASPNSYTGNTTVEEGKLRLDGANLAAATDVYLQSGATLELNFNGAPNVVDSLFIDGVSRAAGTWGAEGSAAEHTSPLITGTGFLQVSTFIPPPLWGDYNEDGKVDASDYVVWRDSLGSALSLPNDDTVGVGPDDYDRWRCAFRRRAIRRNRLGQRRRGAGANVNPALVSGMQRVAFTKPRLLDIKTRRCNLRY